jgi:hypothetical protein
MGGRLTRTLLNAHAVPRPRRVTNASTVLAARTFPNRAKGFPNLWIDGETIKGKGSEVNVSDLLLLSSLTANVKSFSYFILTRYILELVNLHLKTRLDIRFCKTAKKTI